jgi:hypothetical protein
MNRNRTSSNRRDSLVSITRVDSSIEVPKARAGVPDAPSVGVCEHLYIPRVLSVACEGATSKTRSVIFENDQGARLAKNRGFALQSFATTTDLDLEHTLTAVVDRFSLPG